MTIRRRLLLIASVALAVALGACAGEAAFATGPLAGTCWEIERHRIDTIGWVLRANGELLPVTTCVRDLRILINP